MQIPVKKVKPISHSYLSVNYFITFLQIAIQIRGTEQESKQKFGSLEASGVKLGLTWGLLKIIERERTL